MNIARLALPLALSILLLFSACRPGPASRSGAEATQFPSASQLPAPLIIDGRFEDWQTVGSAYRDPAGDGLRLDFTGLRMASDRQFLYFQIDLESPISLQNDSGLVLYIDVDNDADSGEGPGSLGAELRFDLGEGQGTFTWEDETMPLSHADLMLIPAPAITSQQFEIALARDTVLNGISVFPGDTVRVILQDESEPAGDRLPDDPQSAAFTIDSDPLPVPEAIEISRDPASTSVRIVSWNVLNEGLFDSRRSQAFQTILALLNPDIIAFQEIDNRAASGVANRMVEWLGGEWFAMKQRDLVTVSRFRFVEDWTATFRPLDFRLFPTMLDIDGQRLLIFNAHLSCCDNDVERQEQADSFIAFLRDAQTPTGQVDIQAMMAILLLGDLNLVGDASQLNTLVNGEIVNAAVFGADHFPDWGDGALVDLLPRHSHGNMTYTWRNDGSRFAPGRLDYVLCACRELQIERAFVLNTLALPAEQADQLGLNGQETAIASDHLPIVVDLRLTSSE